MNLSVLWLARAFFTPNARHVDLPTGFWTSRIMGEIENFRSREGTGAFALNRIVKAMLGSQAIFTLARRGDLDAVRRALELDADPNVSDSLGIRPLTYAAGNGHEAVVAALIEGRADARARVGANEVLGMFAPLPAERRRCIETAPRAGRPWGRAA